MENVVLWLKSTELSSVQFLGRISIIIWKQGQHLPHWAAPGAHEFYQILFWVTLQTCSLPEAKAFMKQQVHEFKQQIVLNPSCAKLHSALGSYYDRLQNYCQAIHHLSLAVELDPSNKETRWLLTKVKRDKDLQYKTKSIEDTFKVSKCPDKILHLPEPIEVS